MTEPLVIPRPKTKPVPKRKSPKPKPKENDPWTVPAPKVNPTPKAILKTKVMLKKGNKIVGGKMVITTKDEFDFLKEILSKEAFYEKYTLSTGLVTRFLAEAAMVNANFGDVSPIYLSQEGRRSANNN